MPETNPILQSLYARKSVRVFEEKTIPAGMKQAILEAAAQAPSAGCQQLYTILDITDPALKAALADSCDHQPFIAKAPLVLVFCADCRKWYDAYKEAGCTPRTPGVGDLMLAVTDTAIAAQNAAPWSISCTKTATAPWTVPSCATPSATRLAPPVLMRGARPSTTASTTPALPAR